MSKTLRRHLSLEKVDGVTVVTLLDKKITADENIQEVGDELYSLIDHDARSRILLNFGNVQFMSSEVIGKLMLLKRKVDNVEGTLKLCCVHRDLLQVFRLIGAKTFDIHPEEQAALDKF